MKSVLQVVSMLALLVGSYSVLLPWSLTHSAIHPRLFYRSAVELLHSPLHDTVESYLEFWHCNGGYVECFAN